MRLFIEGFAKFLLILLALTGCEKKASPPAFGDFPQPVHVAEVVEKSVPIYLDVMGRIDSPLQVDLRAQIAGRLESMHVSQGKLIKKGDLLFTIDPTPFQASVDQAKAVLKKNESTLRFAKAKLERYRTLAKKDYISQLNYDQYQNEVDTLTAQTIIDRSFLTSAEINLAYCSIKAPMDGKISESHVDPGSLVCPNDAIPLTEIRQLDPIDVRFSLCQNDFLKVKDNAELSLEVLLPGATQPHCTGKVYFIDNHLNVNTGTILCKGALSNSDHALWPGEYVRVRLLTKWLPNALIIPFAAVQIGQQGSFIYVVKPDMSVEMRKIEIATRFDNQAVLAEGLRPGELVVIDGQLNLRPESKVMIK